jgi:transposase
MWTTKNRARYDRSRLRYPSDLTDAEWDLIAPLIPRAKRGGNKRTVNLREVANGLMYVLSTGCQWRAIPKDLPPRSTLHDYLDLWSWDGTLDRIHFTLYVQCRDRAGREASPTAAVIDSQSVKSAEKGGAASIRTAMMRARVRLDGAYHQWRKVPPRELSIDLVADERLGRVTGRAEAS